MSIYGLVFFLIRTVIVKKLSIYEEQRIKKTLKMENISNL